MLLLAPLPLPLLLLPAASLLLPAPLLLPPPPLRERQRLLGRRARHTVASAGRLRLPLGPVSSAHSGCAKGRAHTNMEPDSERQPRRAHAKRVNSAACFVAAASISVPVSVASEGERVRACVRACAVRNKLACWLARPPLSCCASAFPHTHTHTHTRPRVAAQRAGGPLTQAPRRSGPAGGAPLPAARARAPRPPRAEGRAAGPARWASEERRGEARQSSRLRGLNLQLNGESIGPQCAHCSSDEWARGCHC